MSPDDKEAIPSRAWDLLTSSIHTGSMIHPVSCPTSIKATFLEGEGIISSSTEVQNARSFTSAPLDVFMT
jgi:hypothetical protein